MGSSAWPPPPSNTAQPTARGRNHQKSIVVNEIDLGATIGGLLQNQVGPLFDQLPRFAPGCILVLFGDDWSSHVRYALEDVFTACHALQKRIFTLSKHLVHHPHLRSFAQLLKCSPWRFWGPCCFCGTCTLSSSRSSRTPSWCNLARQKRPEKVIYVTAGPLEGLGMYGYVTQISKQACIPTNESYCLKLRFPKKKKVIQLQMPFCKGHWVQNMKNFARPPADPTVILANTTSPSVILIWVWCTKCFRDVRPCKTNVM